MCGPHHFPFGIAYLYCIRIHFQFGWMSWLYLYLLYACAKDQGSIFFLIFSSFKIVNSLLLYLIACKIRLKCTKRKDCYIWITFKIMDRWKMIPSQAIISKAEHWDEKSLLLYQHRLRLLSSRSLSTCCCLPRVRQCCSSTKLNTAGCGGTGARSVLAVTVAPCTCKTPHFPRQS